MSAALLEARDVHVRIGDATILHGADLTVHAGELRRRRRAQRRRQVDARRAPSPGLQKLEAGDVRWSGTPLGELKGRKIARLRAFVPQRAPVPAGVTVREAVELGRSPHIKPLGAPDPPRPRRGRPRAGAHRRRRVRRAPADDALGRRAAARADRRRRSRRRRRC